MKDYRHTIEDALKIAGKVQGLMKPDECRYLADMASEYDRPISWAELGSWHGKSATCTGLCLPKGSRLVLVENFKGFKPVRKPISETHASQVKRGLLRSISDLEKRRPDIEVELCEAFSAEAAAQFDDQTFEYVFIDADHAKPAITADITAWLPKLAPGGVLAGHDYRLSTKGNGKPNPVVGVVREMLPGFVHIPKTTIWHWDKPESEEPTE
jgi:predicted O-methyltransferase YrrM